ncbi:MAG: tRNA (N6-threonylcarbamoyladenosine(37)-N6)-methyltransferase TrmO [Candidatus Bathyarchaeota archaeon]|nr:MAG: tRNA (N6-threonylcarbamoyladenosine(37)-N6)-methyltransferase TrmO [Candidatus Bathyarchaeota archaeon]
MSTAETIELKPVGFVKTGATGKGIREKRVTSQIVLHPGLEEALDGIEDFSHIFVIFWMHKLPEEKRETKKVHPRGRSDMPLLGVFATRTPHRPNPLGLTLVELLNVKGNKITVRGLDAFDGTPVLDVKPFDYWDMNKDAKVPSWWMKLRAQSSRIVHARDDSEGF